MSDPFERIMRRITVTESGCWEYPTLNDSGYGVVGEGPRNSRKLRTHRVTYERLVGPIPDGTEIDHLCRNRACCNPQHLEAVTRSVNMLRGVRKTMQTHCKQGHEFTPENTRNTPRQRVCLTCARARSRIQSRKQQMLISAAAEALGMKQTDYGSTYGWSVHTAQSILNNMENA